VNAETIPVIVIPVLNRYDLLERCITSIDHPVEYLVIVDNGNQKPVATNPQIKNIHILSMPTNLGVGPSWNLGIKSTPYADGWILLNSDAAFKPGQLQTFYNNCKPNNITLTNTEPAWCCAWVGSQVVERIGLFSECYVPAYFEDLDYQQRAEHSKFPVITVDMEIIHDNSSTIMSQPELETKNHHSFAQNEALHKRRWRTGTPEAGQWDLMRRKKLGWDIPC
jgi:GT2 family glycosyltransferase